jgi:hypothetical protein
LRRDLERAVIQARDIAEEGARAALAVLGVEAPAAPLTLAASDRDLRTALRARGRAIGGGVLPLGIDGLIEEIAYEQWHRMLFARFLAENGLLLHPGGASVSMADVAELAAEEGERDPWVLAARYASAMLPGIFRADDPAHQVRFAPEHRARLEAILAALPPELFAADDALGWVYQFWQTKRKKEVNDSGRKIGGADLPPVTQLFTEHYMVRFLLENSLGAWWAARHPESPLVREWQYLRFREDGTLAAGAFDGWPRCAAEITVMDPCMGSGHFLVAAGDMLRKMRMEEEGLGAAEAALAVLRDNLFGLELDPRCTQLGAFALALDAWKVDGYQPLPVPNVACSGIAIKGQLEDWRRLAGGDAKMADALERLYDLFQDAPELGSLIDPSAAAGEGLWRVDPNELLAKLEVALGHETHDPAAAVFGAAAEGTAKAARLLSLRYWIVVTNPPFLTRGRQSQTLARFLHGSRPDAAADLASALLDAFGHRLWPSGLIALVEPHQLLFLAAYSQFRRRLLTQDTWQLLAFLGHGAFDSITGQVVNVSLVLLRSQLPQADQHVAVVDAEASPDGAGKARALSTVKLALVKQTAYAIAVDHRITKALAGAGRALLEYAESSHGQGTFDTRRFNLFFWEIPDFRDVWVLRQSTVPTTVAYGGCDGILRWERGQGSLAAMMEEWRTRGYSSGKWRAGVSLWGRSGVLVSQMGDLPVTLYAGAAFDENAAVLTPRDPSHLAAIWAYTGSSEYVHAVRLIDPSLKVTPGSLAKVPFDLEHWQEVASEQYPNGLPPAQSDSPSQWLFRGVTPGSTAPLQVAVARLLGYRWPAQDPDGLDELADADGIVSLPAVGGESPAAERLRVLLARAYGSDWSPALLDRLVAEAGSPGATLESWLRDDFFSQHARAFANHPFVWQVWDGRKDGFCALVNYHRLDARTLEKLTYTYLNDWIERQRAHADEPTGEARLVAALNLQDKLKLILEGEPPYDIYVRWKPLGRQPLGWDPDIDDGLRVNVRPFVTAGVLRAKFTINWNKDRGANPDGSERMNDLHLTRAQKLAAREGAA